MKIRTDFVTNSSSSSFIVAVKPELTEKQKQAIIDFVIEQMLGDDIHSTKFGEEYYKEIMENEYDSEEYEEFKAKIKEAEDRGLKIYSGSVSSEDYYSYIDLREGLFEAINKADPDNTMLIESDLDF